MMLGANAAWRSVLTGGTMKLRYFTGAVALVTANGLLAEETVSCTYDARGQLVKVERKGDGK